MPTCPPQFDVQLTRKQTITRMDSMWPEARQRALLVELLEEPTDLTGAELTEMLELVLQDLEPVECGTKLLEVLLGDEMTSGMRANVARQMLESEPWVEHSHMNWHRAIYEAAWLAHASHGACFTTPRGVKLTFAIRAQDDDAIGMLTQPLTAALALRLVAPCAPRALLWRLFEDALAGTTFPEAENIAWFAAWSANSSSTATLTMEGSHHWWDAFERGDVVSVTAWPDAASASLDAGHA